MSSAQLRLKASVYALKLGLDKTPRQARLCHCQSENWRIIANYVTNQHFLQELRVFNCVLIPNLEHLTVSKIPPGGEPVNGYECIYFPQVFRHSWFFGPRHTLHLSSLHDWQKKQSLHVCFLRLSCCFSGT